MRKKVDAAKRERYELLRGMLEERRRDIQEKLRSLREMLPLEAADVRDTEEQSVDDFVQEVDFALMQMKSDTLRRIDEAMHRLEDGTYGVCVDCSTDISAGRLKALPFAELCRSCQELREAELREAHDTEDAKRIAKALEIGVR
jgi:DnaK suppressor protein